MPQKLLERTKTPQKDWDPIGGGNRSHKINEEWGPLSPDDSSNERINEEWGPLNGDKGDDR